MKIGHHQIVDVPAHALIKATLITERAATVVFASRRHNTHARDGWSYNTIEITSTGGVSIPNTGWFHQNGWEYEMINPAPTPPDLLQIDKTITNTVVAVRFKNETRFAVRQYDYWKLRNNITSQYVHHPTTTILRHQPTLLYLPQPNQPKPHPGIQH